jgi:hypothetical protein
MILLVESMVLKFANAFSFVKKVDKIIIALHYTILTRRH